MTSISLSSPLRIESKQFLKLAIPLVSAQVAQSLTGFFDTIMMGRLGAETLAAGGLASWTFIAILNTAAGLVMGISPLIAEAYGAGKKTRIEKLTRQGFWLVLLLSIPMMVAIAHLDSMMLKWGQAETTVTLANSYLDIILWGFFPALGFAMLRGVVSGLAQARPIMIIVTFGTVFNIIGNYILMFFFPRAIVGIYLNLEDPANTEIINLALPILIIASLSQILDAVQKITYGALQGLQDTRIPVLLNMTAFWGVGLSLGYFLGFHLNLGGVGLWLGQSVGVATAAVLFLLRFRDRLKILKNL